MYDAFSVNQVFRVFFNIIFIELINPHTLCFFPLSSCHVLFIAEVPGGSSSSMMSVLTEKAVVRKEELWDMVGTDQWKINNSLDEKYEPRPVSDIVREACSQVGRELPYCIFSRNCEHFVNELRYGKAKSQQVSGPTFYVQICFISRAGLCKGTIYVKPQI